LRDTCVPQDILDILLGTWDAIKDTKDGKVKYSADEGSDPPYNGKFTKMLSRKFGEIKKEHAKQTAAVPARAGSVENVPDNEQIVVPQA
jgi:hypothetical protein